MCGDFVYLCCAEVVACCGNLLVMFQICFGMACTYVGYILEMVSASVRFVSDRFRTYFQDVLNMCSTRFGDDLDLFRI